MQLSLCTTTKYGHLCGQLLNLDKTNGWGTTPASQKSIAGFLGNESTMVLEAVAVGNQINITERNIHCNARERGEIYEDFNKSGLLLLPREWTCRVGAYTATAQFDLALKFVP